MKLRKLLIALAAFSFSLGASAAPGSDHSHDAKPEWAELFGDAPLPVVWQSTTASIDNISAALSAKKMEGVADWAETIHLATHALLDQVKLPDAERKKRLDGVLEQAAKLADEVLDGANHNEPDQTAAAFKRLQAAIALAKARLPKEITEAPAATPRFAKAPKHDAEHKH
jgi:hypothetical protein